MRQKAMTFKELEHMVNKGITCTEKLQGTLRGEHFQQAEEISRALETIRFMLKDKVLFYNRKHEQKRIDELTGHKGKEELNA